MIKYLSLFLLVLIHTSGIAQQDLKWGKTEGRSGDLIDILPFYDQDFYTVRWKGGNFVGGYYLSRFDDLNESASNRISIAVNYNIANYEGTMIIGDAPAIFLSNARDGREQVFVQPYGYDLKPKGDAKLIAEYDVLKGMSKTPLKFIQSKDKKYFAVLWLLVGKKKENDVYGYAIYNDKFKQVDEGEYEVPFQSQFSQISNHLLTNAGHYFFVLKEFERNEERRIGQSDLIYKNMHIYQVSKDEGLDRYTIPLSGKRAEAISVNTDDSSSFTITGVYGANEFKGVKGVFYLKLDFENKEIVQEGFQEFDRSFITEDWSQKDINRIEKRESQGKDQPSLYNYQMKEAQILADGSIVGVMEQQYVMVRTFSDARSMITYMYTYYFNDIIVFKIGQDGEFDWIEKIKKNQISTNDGGPYSSYASVMKNNKLIFYFNDSDENYSESGSHIDGYYYNPRFGVKNTVLATVEMDLSSGAQSRYVVNHSKDTKTISTPKLFAVDYKTGDLILYSNFKGKENYGILKGK